MSKKIRHQKILDLVQEHAVASQEQLRELLEAVGFSVTQSTLSRDINDLGLMKGGKGYRVPPDAPDKSNQKRVLENALRQYLLRCVPAQNLIVLRTEPGDAQALASAVDRADYPGVAGSLGGDDTVLLVVESAETATAVAAEFLRLAKQP